MNNKKIISTIIVITLVIISFFSGSTFAKYLSQKTVKGSLEVARWKVTEEFLVQGKSYISKEINLANTYNQETLENGKIAPGTNGTFTIVIDATGTETGLDYQVDFSNISGYKPHNLVFSYEGTEYLDISVLSEVMRGSIAANDDNKTINLPIMWSWEYETINKGTSLPDDEQDTLDR